MSKLQQHRLTFLLAALVFVLTVAPLVEGTRFGAALFAAGMTAVFVGGVMANRERTWMFRAAIIVAALAIPTSWVAVFTRYNPLDLSQYFIIILFCGTTAAMILMAVMRQYMATAHAVVGAICVYLLIGLTWATVYSAIEYIEDEPFNYPQHHRLDAGAPGRTSFSQLTYFSFVTMSTLGYGDMTPRTPLAETACWMQSIVGQLYIAILIARLIGAMPHPGKRRE